MKPSELDKANGKHEEWMPEVGDKFEWSLNGQKYDEGVMLFNDGVTLLIGHAKYPENRWHYKSNDPDLRFRPIQTEAEKKRDEQIEKLSEALAYSFEHGGKPSEYVEEATDIYNRGVRVIAPDEYVVKRLTDEQLEKLSRVFGIGEADAVRVQIELGITP